ncbi:TRAP transporter large permease [Labedella phragmitis]|uniref:TRAP transporter large permease n=1 Tax=Labedella phragmitis TaxID=2498849 RepID=A0A444PPB3_9MICO|nr:TRAP transporter large permease [Labedella phragmitis]RWZ46233.1 TRAP transporter large permease [Labedella phragmitis]
MTVAAVVGLAILVLLVLLAIKMPIALALGVTGALGLMLLKGTGYATDVLGSAPFSTTYSYSLTIVPMFILMGLFAVRARVAEYVFAVANHVVGRAPGGLGVATVMACAGFAAVSGSSIGTAATMSKLSVSQMRSHGYPASTATALVAVSGTLGVMIPPSTFLVLYAIMTNTSVAQVLAAGVLPGLLSAAAYIAYIMTFGARRIGRSTDSDDLGNAVARARLDASAAARLEAAGRRGGAERAGDRVRFGEGSARGATATVEAVDTRTATSRTTTSTTPGASSAAASADVTRLRDLHWRGVVYIAILFTIVLGGMYSGVFTSTESAAIGALASVVILIVENRKDGMRVILSQIKGALLDTGSTTSMVFFIVVGSSILSAFFIAARVPEAVTDWVTGLGLAPMLAMALLLACLIPLGMVLESLSILVITVPILYPIAVEFGFEPVWLGIMVVKLIEIGMVTPPVGINAFVVAGATGVKTETVFKGILPLFLVDLAVTAVLFLFPQISLLLPSLVSPNAG